MLHTKLAEKINPIQMGLQGDLIYYFVKILASYVTKLLFKKGTIWRRVSHQNTLCVGLTNTLTAIPFF